MKEGVRKESIITAGLYVSQGHCKRCHKEIIFYGAKREQKSNPIGAKCKHCGIVVWSNSRVGPLAKRWEAPKNFIEEKEKEEQFRHWFKANRAEFYSYLSDCPECGAHDWEMYNAESFVRNFVCPQCGERDPVQDWKNVTIEHYGDQVWWFGPDGWR
ncbi:MAG: hypothetical protein WC539_01305 [Nitrospirota bacterium]